MVGMLNALHWRSLFGMMQAGQIPPWPKMEAVEPTSLRGYLRSTTSHAALSAGRTTARRN